MFPSFSSASLSDKQADRFAKEENQEEEKIVKMGYFQLFFIFQIFIIRDGFLTVLM